MLRFLTAACLALPVAAQIPNTLLHSIPSPVTSQARAQLGHCVATDGAYTVVGAPNDDTGGWKYGVVKVFNSTTGELIHVLRKPGSGSGFGSSVAISGTRIVVGDFLDNTGANNAGSAFVYDLNSATPTVPVITLNNPSPAAFDGFGIAVAIDGMRIVVGTYRDDTGVEDAGCAYVFDLSSGTPTDPVATLNNPAPAIDDDFGRSVAISGTWIVVGAYRDDVGGLDTGSAYVYDLASGSPTAPVAVLNDPDPSRTEYFGRSVGVSGMRVVVGAERDNIYGSAHVYDLAGQTPTVPVATLTYPNPSFNLFGFSVAISGALVVVGAYSDDVPGAGNAGSAYIYDLDSGMPTIPVLSLNNPAPMPNDEFGFSVSICGTQVVVGAHLDDAGASDAGSAYIYDVGSATPAVPVTTLNHPGPATHDQFGNSVAVSGTRVVVGAWQDDTNADFTGSAYVYDMGSGTPTVPVFTLNNPNPGAFDGFGYSVAISGSRIVIGAHQDDHAATNAGNVHVYDLGNSNPAAPILMLSKPNAATSDAFGNSVAIDGALVVVGAYLDNTGATDGGSAYVFDLNSSTPTMPVATLNNPTPATNDRFGGAVAISGNRVVVGAYQDDTGATDAGSAYVYDLSSGSPTVPVAVLSNPGPAAVDQFGFAVAINGSRVAVAAPGDNTAATDAGRVYVYDIVSGTPTVPIAILNNPGPAFQDNFGYSLAISGARVAVGTHRDDTGATDAGIVYLYDLDSGTPHLPIATLNNPSPVQAQRFGTSVAIDGPVICIGVPLDDSTALDEGGAYIFGPHPLDQDSDGLHDSWETAQFGTTSGHSALDDFDHDGYSELLEQAFGLNPTVSTSGGLPPVVEEGGYLTMTITKQPGVTYEVQSAGTLVPGQPDSFSAASTTVLINDATTLKVRDNVLMGTPPSRFMRVQVTAAP